MVDEYKAPPEDKPTSTPPNVVGDNSGVVPVQPVGTSDPTLDDNTNPRVPFDGADPANIPPHDSNEQLHIAAGKRAGSERRNLVDAAERRREAVEAAYDNSRDVRDVLKDDSADGDEGGDKAAPRSGADASHPRASRSTPPQGRQSQTQKSQKS